MKRLLPWLAAVALVSGCRSPERSDAPDANGASVRSTSIASALARGELLLDGPAKTPGARHALLGFALPVLPDGDGGRTYTLRVIDEQGHEVSLAPPSASALTVVEDARLLPGDHTLAAISSAGDVLLLDLHDAAAEPRIVDHGAHGPLAVTRGKIAYARGAMGDHEIAQVETTSGRVVPLTVGQAPCWLPAFTPDGAHVVYVSAVSGFPELYALGEDHMPHQISHRKDGPPTPFPTEPVSPTIERRADGLWLRFVDESGEHTLALPSLAGAVR